MSEWSSEVGFINSFIMMGASSSADLLASRKGYQKVGGQNVNSKKDLKFRFLLPWYWNILKVVDFSGLYVLREAAEKANLIISTRLVEYLSKSGSVGNFQRIPKH